MNYITLNPEAFFDDKGVPSKKILSHYCQFVATDKFIYNGGIDGTANKKLIFPNIVKLNYVTTNEITQQFPDIIEVKTISYILKNMPDIGNLKSVDNFHLYLPYIDTRRIMQFIKDYIELIDENTMIINGKELIINEEWRIDYITNRNYKEHII